VAAHDHAAEVEPIFSDLEGKARQREEPLVQFCDRAARDERQSAGALFRHHLPDDVRARRRHGDIHDVGARRSLAPRWIFRKLERINVVTGDKKVVREAVINDKRV